MRIGCPVHQFSDLSPSERTTTHDTWLQRNIQRAVIQILPSQQRSCRRDGKHLRVCGHVIQSLGLIMSPGNHLTFTNDYRSNRDFPLFFCQVGFLQGFPHEHLVFIHKYYFYSPTRRQREQKSTFLVKVTNFLPHFFFLHVRDKHDQHLTYINQDTTREIPSFIFFGLNNFILTFSF